MKKNMLLHSCCGPCSTQVIDFLKNDYDITIFYCNPNIDTEEEYLHRLNEQKRYCKIVGIEVIEDNYCPNEFLDKVKGLENEREGGARCERCFYFRLEETAQKAKDLGFDIFGTTLTVSPHKSTLIINKVGKEIEEKCGILYLEESFKKKDGYLRSINLSKELSLYRQNYCGCRFSIRREN